VSTLTPSSAWQQASAVHVAPLPAPHTFSIPTDIKGQLENKLILDDYHAKFGTSDSAAAPIVSCKKGKIVSPSSHIDLMPYMRPNWIKRIAWKI
jgi:hypothetical protein